MTGAEFAQKIWSGVVPDGSIDLLMVVREFDAAVAALTAERDALALDFANCADVGRRLESQLAAMTAERDEALEDAAFKELQRDEARGEHCSCCDAARTERDASNLKFEDAWKELQAARADAAAMSARLENCKCGQ